jgi:hypothetical protein
MASMNSTRVLAWQPPGFFETPATPASPNPPPILQRNKAPMGMSGCVELDNLVDLKR